MNKEYIPYEQALELKELGFDSVCFGFYNPRHEIGDLRANPLYEHSGGCFDNYNRTDYLVSAPLYQQAFRWFREEYSLHSYIEGPYPWFRFYINSEDDRCEGHKHLLFEEAEIACLKKLIELVKN